MRQFDVRIEDALVLDNYDIYARGQLDSTKKSFDVAVSDGELNVSLENAGTNNPAIAAIEVVLS